MRRLNRSRPSGHGIPIMYVDAVGRRLQEAESSAGSAEKKLLGRENEWELTITLYRIVHQ